MLPESPPWLLGVRRVSPLRGIKEQAMTAFLEITMKISPEKRPQAGGVYTKYRQPFLSGIPGAKSKELLLRAEDVQVLHGFDSKANAENYLGSELFQKDVVAALKPCLLADPEIRIYECA
jgi:hypothetical protein